MNDGVIEAFNEMKMKHANKYMIMRINDDLTEIVLENQVQASEYDDFVAALPQVISSCCLYFQKLLTFLIY